MDAMLYGYSTGTSVLIEALLQTAVTNASGVPVMSTYAANGLVSRSTVPTDLNSGCVHSLGLMTVYPGSYACTVQADTAVTTSDPYYAQSVVNFRAYQTSYVTIARLQVFDVSAFTQFTLFEQIMLPKRADGREYTVVVDVLYTTLVTSAGIFSVPLYFSNTPVYHYPAISSMNVSMDVDAGARSMVASFQQTLPAGTYYVFSLPITCSINYTCTARILAMPK